MHSKQKHILPQILITLFCLIICVSIFTTTLSATNVHNVQHTEPKPAIKTTVETKPSIAPTETPTEPAVIDEPEFLTFAPDITFKSEYVIEPNIIPYAICKPSCANPDTESALIIWLHGMQDTNVKPYDFMTQYFPGLVSEWSLENFNAYIVSPQLTGKYTYSSWCNANLETNIRDLINSIKSQYNIADDKIYLTGASLGGQGVIYHAIKLSDIFSKAIILSGYGINLTYTDLTIPTLCITGMTAYGEDSRSIQYMEYNIKPIIPAENYITLPTSHSNLTTAAFTQDENNNNQSDLIEWLFSDETVFNINPKE